MTALALFNRAENSNFFGLPIQAKDIEFSYITTALNYKNIYDWLGLNSRIDIDMIDLREENLKRLFSWMFSKDQQGRTILGESRNLADMAAIVASDAAVKMLEETGRLSEAYLYTDGPQAALEQAMDQVADKLRVVWNMLPKTKPLIKKHLNQADGLFEDIKSVRSYLRDRLEE